MTLPLVAEVRAARERADRAVQASVLLQRALALETSMGLVGEANTSVPEQVRDLCQEADELCLETPDPSNKREDQPSMSAALRRVVS